jgi:intracellular septation protein
MIQLLTAARFLLLDLASTLSFLLLYLLTRHVPVAVAGAMAFGAAQIAWQKAKQRPIDTMQWMSLLLVLGSGTATLLTADARFVMLKPSLIYAIVGVVMLKRGWMNRYLPPVAMQIVPDVAIVFGYLWSALMFVSAALNIFIATRWDVATWAWFMSLYGIVSKVTLFLIQFAAMKLIGKRRRAQIATTV